MKIKKAAKPRRVSPLQAEFNILRQMILSEMQSVKSKLYDMNEKIEHFKHLDRTIEANAYQEAELRGRNEILQQFFDKTMEKKQDAKARVI